MVPWWEPSRVGHRLVALLDGLLDEASCRAYENSARMRDASNFWYFCAVLSFRIPNKQLPDNPACCRAKSPVTAFRAHLLCEHCHRMVSEIVLQWGGLCLGISYSSAM